MISEPKKKDLTVPQGATYPVRLRYLDSLGAPIDISSATVRAQLSNQFYEGAPDITLTTENGKAFVEAEGWFGFTLLPADTEALEATVYYYDLVITTSDGDVTRALEGQITITPGVPHV